MENSQEPDSKECRTTREQSDASRADLVEKALHRIEEKLASSEVKATFGDFIRLLQLQKELQIDRPQEIKVTWIDSSETESVSEE
jgi:hypothetical protein